MRSHGPCTALLVFVLAAMPMVVHAQSETTRIRWNMVLGALPSQLSSSERLRVETLLRREHSYGTCTDRIARCLEAKQPSRSARRLAGFVIRRVRVGWTDGQISKGIRQRRDSIFPDASQLASIDLSTAHCRGPVKAPVTIVEYSDFQCPICRDVSKTLRNLVHKHRPNVRLCFKHFPLRHHKRAVPAAVAALAAARQGRFWQMHNALFATKQLSDAVIVNCARRAGIPNLKQWRRDRLDSNLAQQVANDKQEGAKNGVKGTPGLFFNRKQYLFHLTTEQELADRLDEELELVGNRP